MLFIKTLYFYKKLCAHNKEAMYLKEFEIRWNDIDANRHMANSAYIVLRHIPGCHFWWRMGLIIRYWLIIT